MNEVSGATEEGVLAVIRDTSGAVLMQLRDQRDDICWPNHWTVLGGGIESGESAHDAVVREVREESALEMHELTMVTQVVDIHGSGQLLHVFAGIFDGDLASLRLGEGQRLEFVAPDAWANILMPPFVRELLQGNPGA
ncbi:MAG: NUDIX domain-containing protein [Rhodoglobus sp.]